jgi:hypothetical protein
MQTCSQILYRAGNQTARASWRCQSATLGLRANVAIGAQRFASPQPPVKMTLHLCAQCTPLAPKLKMNNLTIYCQQTDPKDAINRTRGHTRGDGAHRMPQPVLPPTPSTGNSRQQLFNPNGPQRRTHRLTKCQNCQPPRPRAPFLAKHRTAMPPAPSTQPRQPNAPPQQHLRHSRRDVRRPGRVALTHQGSWLRVQNTG